MWRSHWYGRIKNWRSSGAVSSAVISGVFPLLFGQGPLAALGGATGGFLGGKFGGQMGGFAGGLAGTTVIILQMLQ